MPFKSRVGKHYLNCNGATELEEPKVGITLDCDTKPLFEDLTARSHNIVFISERVSCAMSGWTVKCLTDFGYCIVPGLLVSQRDTIFKFGQAILNDVHMAAEILRNKAHKKSYW